MIRNILPWVRSHVFLSVDQEDLTRTARAHRACTFLLGFLSEAVKMLNFHNLRSWIGLDENSFSVVYGKKQRCPVDRPLLGNSKIRVRIFRIYTGFVKTLVTRRHAPFLHAARRAASLTLSTHGELNPRPSRTGKSLNFAPCLSRTGRNLNSQETEIVSQQTRLFMAKLWIS